MYTKWKTHYKILKKKDWSQSTAKGLLPMTPKEAMSLV